MTLPQIARQLELEALNPQVRLDPAREVDQAHASDLLSDVLANAPAGGLLLTIQVHMNVIAVSLHAGLSAVIFTSGLSPGRGGAGKGRRRGPAPVRHPGVHLRGGREAVRAGPAGAA